MLNDAHDIATITRTTDAAATTSANVNEGKNSKLMPLHNAVAVNTEANNPTRQKIDKERNRISRRFYLNIIQSVMNVVLVRVGARARIKQFWVILSAYFMPDDCTDALISRSTKAFFISALCRFLFSTQSLSATFFCLSEFSVLVWNQINFFFSFHLQHVMC